MQARALVAIRYAVSVKPEAWEIPEVPVPEATAHDAAVLRIYLLLSAWAAARGNCRVARNLALRWLENYPRTGIDPDVCVISPAPADFESLTSLRLWEPSRTPPVFCAEVVSASHPYKDYSEIHERYAAAGVFELVVLDPGLFGPKALGGPVLLQLWRRDASGAFERLHFGDGPVFSQALDAWISVIAGQLLISSDQAGVDRWLTGEERALAEMERALAEKERALAEKERALAAREEIERRLRELELSLERNRAP
ncbi:MAG TPA: Uma2 family endonuclease [Polyangiaceae bacterium]|nr:Uma2 family endonuclease [Polyangiaceae bacterium]